MEPDWSLPKALALYISVPAASQEIKGRAKSANAALLQNNSMAKPVTHGRSSDPNPNSSNGNVEARDPLF